MVRRKRRWWWERRGGSGRGGGGDNEFGFRDSVVELGWRRHRGVSDLGVGVS